MLSGHQLTQELIQRSVFRTEAEREGRKYNLMNVSCQDTLQSELCGCNVFCEHIQQVSMADRALHEEHVRVQHGETGR